MIACRLALLRNVRSAKLLSVSVLPGANRIVKNLNRGLPQRAVCDHPRSSFILLKSKGGFISAPRITSGRFVVSHCTVSRCIVLYAMRNCHSSANPKRVMICDGPIKQLGNSG